MLNILARIKKFLKGRQPKTPPPGVRVVAAPRKPSDPQGPKGTKLVLLPCTAQLPVA